MFSDGQRIFWSAIKSRSIPISFNRVKESNSSFFKRVRPCDGSSFAFLSFLFLSNKVVLEVVLIVLLSKVRSLILIINNNFI